MQITKKGFYFIGLIVSLYAWITLLYFFGNPGGFSATIIRLGVLLGYTSLFLAALTTSLMKQITKSFGTSFLNIHHVFSVTGVILVTLHPITMAIQWGTLALFIPAFEDWVSFWAGAGPIALYIIYFSALIAVVRKYFSPKIWRILHGFIYVALIFAYFHGVLRGTDFANLGIMITFTAMLIILFEILIYRRYQKYKLKQK
ncbi:MAG: hypothetical protein R6U96_04940 [Promethearchaeia archaeon]